MKKLIVLLLLLIPATASGNEFCMEKITPHKGLDMPPSLDICCDKVAFFKFKNMDALEKLKQKGEQTKDDFIFNFRYKSKNQCANSLEEEYKGNALEACKIILYNECKKSGCRSVFDYGCKGWFFGKNEHF